MSYIQTIPRKAGIKPQVFEVKKASYTSTKTWIVWTACLLAPAAASLIRKFLPGQPRYMAIAAISIVLLAAFWTIIYTRRCLPFWITIPLLLWASFQTMYALFAVTVDYRIALTATFTRISPMAMALIAYASIRSWEDLDKAATVICSLSVLLLPVGIIVAVYGGEVLPYYLQPIEDFTEVRGFTRSGLSTTAAIFNTNAGLSTSMLSLFYLALACVVIAEVRGLKTWKWWLFVNSSGFLVFMSLRRGAVWGCVVGLAGYLIISRRLNFRIIIVYLIFLACIIYVDKYEYKESNNEWGRVEHVGSVDYRDRFSNVFISCMSQWIKFAPLGNYLGYGGPESSAFGYNQMEYTNMWVEVGGAQLVADMGILGAILMPCVIILIIGINNRWSLGLKCHKGVQVLLLFQSYLLVFFYLKEGSCLTVVSICSLFLWSVVGISAALIESDKREFYRRIQKRIR